MEPQSQNLKTAPFLTLGRFHISEDYGFLLPNPLMPLLNCQFLTGYREWRLAHLVLSFITMGYVWQDGETQPKEILPRNLALPFVEVSKNLGLPPILLHSDLVLANWATRNPGGNLDTIFSFPGGESLRGFILVTVLVEKAAVPGIKALVQAVNAILQPSPDSLLQALQRLRVSIQDITGALGQMHDYVNPDVFYSVIRIFLSGWKDNPALPVGLVYEGVSKEPLSYSGGSAAQSTILHAFDEFLGVRHSKESADFLHRMRDYMPPSHRAFIEEICGAPSLRTHVLSSGNGQLLTAYNQCVESLAALRTYHLALVTKYLITAPSKAKARRTSHLPRPPQALEERGTGGSAVMSFLKSVRDKTLEALLHPSG
ncbi:indoleamine 2,3-dioxygenase 2 isoform X4 [Ovis canadensis]|uniref:indoleamine 2,3-dioxygenase 2 isoform X4 n=1 Tax=Ovis canadensis TaxID=37174 RepID=UPI00375102A1